MRLVISLLLHFLSLMLGALLIVVFFFFQAEDGIRDVAVTGVQTCALPIFSATGEEAQHFACGVDSEGLKCWGNNFAGVLGKRPGNAVRNLPPAAIPGLETDRKSVV